MSSYFYEFLESDYLDDFNDITWRYIVKPDKHKFPTYEEGYILDEDKTVRWNREQVAIAQQLYNEEVERLTQLRIRAIEQINNDVKDCISAEIRDNLKISDSKAESLATSIIEYAKQLKDKHNDSAKDFIKHIIMFTDFSKTLYEVNGYYENVIN